MNATLGQYAKKAWRWCKYGTALALMLVSVRCEKWADKLWPGFDLP